MKEETKKKVVGGILAMMFAAIYVETMLIVSLHAVYQIEKKRARIDAASWKRCNDQNKLWGKRAIFAQKAYLSCMDELGEPPKDLNKELKKEEENGKRKD